MLKFNRNSWFSHVAIKPNYEQKVMFICRTLCIQMNTAMLFIRQLVILPSSFTGGPRSLHEKSQDAMAYVRNYGKPDLFITMTCNPNWPEIKDNLHPNTKLQDRYDIVIESFI